MADRDAAEFERVERLMRELDAVFVFGSNDLGIHGAGAAKTAVTLYGARMGVPEGPCGRSYAIPTQRAKVWTGLPLHQIEASVKRFLSYARQRTDVLLVVTRIGCGHAGYADNDIAPMFQPAPENCELPIGWRKQ